jgi:hypothetical protein
VALRDGLVVDPLRDAADPMLVKTTSAQATHS